VLHSAVMYFITLCKMISDECNIMSHAHNIVFYSIILWDITYHIVSQYVMSHDLKLIERLNSNSCVVGALEKGRAFL
jgi:hypothetical protein